MLLRESHKAKSWLLVLTVGWGVRSDGAGKDKVVDCRYVGAVRVTWLWEDATTGWNKYDYGGFRFGHDEARAVVAAREVLPKINKGRHAPVPLAGGEQEVKDSNEMIEREYNKGEKEKEEERV